MPDPPWRHPDRSGSLPRYLHLQRQVAEGRDSPTRLIVGSSAGERPFYQGSVVFDQAGQQPEVDDRAVARWSEVHNLANRRGVFVPGHDDGAGLDLPRVAGFIEEGPYAAGTVFIVEIRNDVYAVHISHPLV